MTPPDNSAEARALQSDYPRSQAEAQQSAWWIEHKGSICPANCDAVYYRRKGYPDEVLGPCSPEYVRWRPVGDETDTSHWHPVYSIGQFRARLSRLTFAATQNTGGMPGRETVEAAVHGAIVRWSNGEQPKPIKAMDADAILALAATGGTGAEGWRGIASAPRDGTRFLALRLSRYRGESRTETVWWQPEFDAFISSCRLMEMAPGYTIDGKTSQLHSPDIFEATHWLCAIPDLPVHPIGGGSRG